MGLQESKMMLEGQLRELQAIPADQRTEGQQMQIADLKEDIRMINIELEKAHAQEAAYLAQMNPPPPPPVEEDNSFMMIMILILIVIVITGIVIYFVTREGSEPKRGAASFDYFN